MVIRILCLGNELAQDDGAGIRLGRALSELPLPPEVEVHLLPELGFACLDLMLDAEQVVFVDATSTGLVPGTCRHLDGDELARVDGSGSSPHALGVAFLLGVARKLAPDRAGRVSCVGVEAQSYEPCRTALSPAVRDALPEAMSTLLGLIGAGPELVELGRSRAVAWANSELGPDQLVSPRGSPRAS